MKKFLFVLLFIYPFLIFSQNDKPGSISLLLDSNINYAPLGIKLIVQDDSLKLGAFISLKVSEDNVFRSIDKEKQTINYEESNNSTVDINKGIASIGVTLGISENVDFYGGLGCLMGTRFVLGYDLINTGTVRNPVYVRKSTDKWIRTNSYVAMPLVSFGVILSKNRLKVSIGNETAFTKDKLFLQSVLNQKSFARLSSFTFGIGYSLN